MISGVLAVSDEIKMWFKPPQTTKIKVGKIFDTPLMNINRNAFNYIFGPCMYDTEIMLFLQHDMFCHHNK